MIVLFFMRSGALFPAKPPEGRDDVENWIQTRLLKSEWYIGHNAKTDDFLILRVADILAVQITEAARLNSGLIVPNGGRMN